MRAPGSQEPAVHWVGGVPRETGGHVNRARTIPLMRLPISGWTVRVGRAAYGRAALEVYEGLRLADVCVATPVSVSVLRGALRARRGPRPWALAWGQLPPGVATATAEFTGTGRRPAVRRVRTLLVEGACWVAETAGEFTGVTVHAGPALVSGRLRRVPGRLRTGGSGDAVGGEGLDGGGHDGR